MNAVSFNKPNFVIWLKWEAAVELAALLFLYSRLEGSWIVFGALFLLPDVSMFGYLAGKKWGAAVYNAAHTYVLALGMGLIGYALGMGNPALWLIWPAHIAWDRMLGYGLKSELGFRITHLNK